MELLIIATVFFVIALVVRRKEAFALRWQPTRHTWVAVGTGLLAFAFSALLLLFEDGSIATRIIHYGLIYIVCGFAIPWGYTLLVERETPAALGLKRERWVLSLILSLVVAGLFVPILIFEGNLGAVGWGQVARASVVLTGAGGLFELFLYYGFIHLRLEKAFGTIPAILATSGIYVLWHVGTQLPLEADPVDAVWKLFLVGVMSQSVFSMTRNLLTIWPFFHAVGVMLDFAVNLEAVDQVVNDFSWAVGTMVLMFITGVVLAWVIRWQSGRRERKIGLDATSST
jgi:membrane protease YdiL (CAAX protease family)